MTKYVIEFDQAFSHEPPEYAPSKTLPWTNAENSLEAAERYYAMKGASKRRIRVTPVPESPAEFKYVPPNTVGTAQRIA